ncbi:MAG: type II CAAX prenyl endopeptidase Rce1 family protein [Anaerolineae bacterium]
MRQKDSTQNIVTSPVGRTAAAFTLPILAALILSILLNNLAALFAGLGLASWYLGLRWVGLPGMGLRGKRPLFSSIGFATMGWTAFLIFRFFFVTNAGYGPPDSTRSFIFLLLFEAFAMQLWAFGLLFRTLADWRGPITAAIGSGVIFGTAAYLFFQESFIGGMTGLLYFILWGVLYGVIRLRTGSLLGAVVIQALQSFTAWVVMVPQTPVAAKELQTLYLAAGIAYLVFIWRLWPKEESDYRV